MQSRLYRSRTDRMLGGVCGGLGAYLGIDPTLVRVFFVLLGITGSGVFIYILLWILIPEEGREVASSGEGWSSTEFSDRAKAVGDDIRQAVNQPNPRAALFIGGALVILGFVYLVQNLHIPWLRWLDFDILWPLLLVVGGIALLQRAWRNR